MLTITNKLKEYLKTEFPELTFGETKVEHCWHKNRFIQILTLLDDPKIHYEYCTYYINDILQGRIELHFEDIDWESNYAKFIDFIFERVENDADIEPYEWSDGYGFRLSKDIEDEEDLRISLPKFIEKFNGILIELMSKNKLDSQEIGVSDFIDCNYQDKKNSNSDVEIYIGNLKDLLRLPLSIPNYQRIYCWDEDNVNNLLNDVFNHMSDPKKKTSNYRLGTIILHRNKQKYDIVDGQQRLITLALLLDALKVHSNLLKEKIVSTKSKKYISYNKFLINSFTEKNNITKEIRSHFLENIDFNVLVLNTSSLDLAYTFFSNQNSRGLDLTDYDLLKAHHLRFIPKKSEGVAVELAQKWNKIINDGRQLVENEEQTDYSRTLDTYLYNLRRWTRKKEYEYNNNHRIKKEYSAAPFLIEIPACGEHFYFNEPIQGGEYYFFFAELYIGIYHTYSRTPEFMLLHQLFCEGSQQWYRDVIEALLFCYFIKFNTQYLSEALSVISRIILQHRYETDRAHKKSIIKYVINSELIQMIDQAYSPTFFLAEAQNNIKELFYPNRKDMKPAQLNVRIKAKALNEHFNEKYISDSFKGLNR